MVKFMKKMLRQTFSVFDPKNVWKWEIISTVSDRNFIIFWQMELVCFFLFFFWCILFILSFGCVTIVNREMKSVSAY